MHQLIFGPELFYDIPEYLKIVSSNSFLQSFSLGHFPIHPIFMGILWLLTRFLPVNAAAMFFGAVSIFIFHKIAKLIFKKGRYWLSTIIFALFPAVWLINTNLMVESVTLTFYLAGIYYFLSKNKTGFFISLFLMIGAHLESIAWIPAIFLLPFLFEKNIKFNKKEIFGFAKTVTTVIFFAILFYILIYYFSGREVTGATEQLSTYFSSGAARMIRNSWLAFATDFGSLTLPVLLFLILKNAESKNARLVWFVFFALTCLMGANWQGDFMGRRIVFASVILALTLYKYLMTRSVLVILYLAPIIIANVILYSNPSPFSVPDIPKDQVLIETRYLKPFTKYNGTILWIGENDLLKIDDYLKSGKRVFLTRQAVTAPYQLLVGQNYHITSLGKIGDSESRFLFEKYSVDPFDNVLEIKPYSGKISPGAGEPVIFFDNSFWGRLARRRIDYGDIGTWIWALATNHRDPTGWVYKDARGI